MLVINAFCDFAPGRDFFGASLDKTLRSVFAAVRVHTSGNGNVFIVASGEPELRMRHEVDFEAVHPRCREEVQAAFDGVVQPDPAHGIIITDDYNPIEYYDAANRQARRRARALNVGRRH